MKGEGLNVRRPLPCGTVWHMPRNAISRLSRRARREHTIAVTAAFEADNFFDGWRQRFSESLGGAPGIQRYCANAAKALRAAEAGSRVRRGKDCDWSDVVEVYVLVLLFYPPLAGRDLYKVAQGAINKVKEQQRAEARHPVA